MLGKDYFSDSRMIFIKNRVYNWFCNIYERNVLYGDWKISEKVYASDSKIIFYKKLRYFVIFINVMYYRFTGIWKC